MASTVSDACTFYHVDKSGTVSCRDLDFHIVENLLYLHLFGCEKHQTETFLNACESNVNQKVLGSSLALALWVPGSSLTQASSKDDQSTC